MPTDTPSNEELAELEAELEKMRREAFDDWAASNEPVDLLDEF